MRKMALLFLVVAVSLLIPHRGLAQVGSGAINGIVSDSSGGVIPGATITITNLATNVKHVAHTNATGSYVILDLLPGRYELHVSKAGFQTALQPAFTLEVNQTSTYDFTLKLKSEALSITVHGQGTMLQPATATLGGVVSPEEVQDLPLNGRNFTQILNLTPGVSPISVAQNSNTGLTQETHALGTFSYPSVNGQSNRSNFFYMNGANDQGSFGSSYNYPPIIDQIQEFKVESHPDSAETGGVLGGVIDVVTKSGTNQFHGDVWEFVRNNIFDARNSVLATVNPFKQNQFGGTFGGPLILPKYNGHDKTWFFAAYEGFRNHTRSVIEFFTVTPAELTGDFSALTKQIYNPFSTAPDPNNSGKFMRQPFLCDAGGNPEPATNRIQAAGIGTACNKIPTSVLDQGMLTYAKGVLLPVSAEISGTNGGFYNTTPVITTQDEASLRFDHNFNERNNLFITYSGYSEPVSSTAGVPTVPQDTWVHGYQGVTTYVHSFGDNGVADFTFARVKGESLIQVLYPNQLLWQQAGISPQFAGNFIDNYSFNPGLSITGYLAFPTLNARQSIPFTDTDEWKGDMALVHGRHTLKFGGTLQTNNNPPCSIRAAISETFSLINTDNSETSAGGDAMASFLLGVPNAASRRNVCESQQGGWVDGLYFQDQWKPTTKLTVNLGLRYDVTLIPVYGSFKNGSAYVGDIDLRNGTYVLQGTPPACGNGVGAPCIPGGTLPANVVVTPYGDHRIFHDTYDNWQPRVGLAYRLNPSTAIRAAFGRFFDNWAGILQGSQNFQGSWPSVANVALANLNLPQTATPTPTATAEDPLNLGTTAPLPAANPFNQSATFANPAIQNPYSDMWNFGVERQFGNNTKLSVNYVGSESIRTDVEATGNTALTPGPGTPQSRAPYTYITPTAWDNSNGRASFEALELSLNRHSSRGLTYRISYTWSKTMDFGSDGWFGDGTAIQNPYNLKASHSVTGYDLTNMFSSNWVYELPFGRGKQLATGNRVLNPVISGWQLNGIVTLTTGQPYSVTATAGIANTGSSVEMANLVGDPHLANPTPAKWFNTAAFAVPPAQTWGNVGRNTMRADWRRDVDLALFRNIRITESKKLQIRAEFFNAFNDVVWAAPVANVSLATFGQVQGIGNSPRQIELGAKIFF
jgi:outer membrane receptor protein involved in Fe transport